MEEIRVELGERSYPIFISPGLLSQTGQLLRQQQIEGKIMVVTNPTVATLYLKPVLTSLRESGYQVNAVEVPDGEEFKSLAEAERLYDALVEGTYDRKSVLIALGGGVIGDLTGLVAATYMRGVRFIQIPTTLLAQVDSSIGGKVAVNHPKGKNLIGAFYQPALVITDVTTLKTLPEAEFNSGMAEVIKHGVILDENYFQLILGEQQLIRHLDPAFLSWIISGSCRIKAQVVEKDEQEKGLRAILNFGHTVGHAIESVTHYTKYKHGEAVALGMIAASRIALKLNILEQPELAENIIEVCQQFNLPIQLPGLPISGIMQSINLDKKAEFNKVRWVLPQKAGTVIITKEVPERIINETLLEMGGLQ